MPYVLSSLASRGALAATVLVFAAAPTDCQSWSDVQVPEDDSRPPITIGAVWGVEGAPLAGVVNRTLSYRIPSGQSPWGPVPVAAAIDESGVYSITERSWYEYQCCVGSTCDPTVTTTAHVVHERDDVSPLPRPGDTVSRGRWIAMDYAPPVCPRGELASFTYRWNISEAVDWRANDTGFETFMQNHEIVYVR